MTANRPQQLPAPRRLWRSGRGVAARRTRGFIMGYLITALIILGIVVAALGRINEQQAEAKYVEDSLTRLKDNIQSIRTQIITCSALISADELATGILFPPQPAGQGNNTLDNVSCPMGTQPDMPLFDGSSGVFLPRPPSGFSAYTYFNDFAGTDPAVDDAVYVETATDSSPGKSAINRLARTYSPDEMTVIESGARTTLRYYLAKQSGS
jgi:hypothetical protein